jgi:hypothetical protein
VETEHVSVFRWKGLQAPVKVQCLKLGASNRTSGICASPSVHLRTGSDPVP